MSSIDVESFECLSFTIVSLIDLEVLFLDFFIREEKLGARCLSIKNFLEEELMDSKRTLVVLNGIAFTVE